MFEAYSDAYPNNWRQEKCEDRAKILYRNCHAALTQMKPGRCKNANHTG